MPSKCRREGNGCAKRDLEVYQNRSQEGNS